MNFNHRSIGFWLSRRRDLTPRRIALDFEDRTYTYLELHELAQRFAAGLLEAGVGKGDRVACISDNCPEYLALLFACAQTGSVLTPISWRLTDDEMQWQISDCEPRVVITGPEWEAFVTDVDKVSFAELGESAINSDPEDTSDFNDPLMILYTSGTTGKPKGAVLTHGNFFYANLNMLISSDIRETDVSLMFLPMFHIGGWNVNTLSVLWKGGRVVLCRSFDAGQALDLIPKKGVTLIMGVPATYLFMSQQPSFESTDTSSVRLMIVGGAPMPEALLRTYKDKGIEIVQGYGLTELAPNALLLPMEDAWRKAGAAGKPYFFTDTRLMGSDGQIIESGEGEIVARGPIVTAGYFRNDGATSDSIKDGWFHTGDIARVDDEGYYWIVDRAKDMIISGGENVYPAEVENCIYEIEGVQEAAVIGVPDEKWGERVLAIIVGDLSAKSVVAHCKSRLATFKVPKEVVLRAEPLPRTPAGKVRKTDLRAPYWEGKERKI